MKKGSRIQGVQVSREQTKNKDFLNAASSIIILYHSSFPLNPWPLETWAPCSNRQKFTD